MITSQISNVHAIAIAVETVLTLVASSILIAKGAHTKLNCSKLTAVLVILLLSTMTPISLGVAFGKID